MSAEAPENLTPEQREAVECRDLDVLVEAGAGTGKTSTTIARYRRIIADGNTPDQILVLTFTDKAAAELRSRVREGEATGSVVSSAWIGTFHAVCARILRSHPVAADVDPRFEILNDVVGTRLRELALERALRYVSEDRKAAEYLSRNQISKWRAGVAATYDKLRARGESRPRLPEMPGGSGEASGFPEFCHRLVDSLLGRYGDEYAAIKRAEGVLDYEDLQLRTLELFESHPAIRQTYRDRFVEIMVDEFQDTNRLQLSLIEALRGEQTTLFTVGDEMQAVYGFRHADVRLFRKRRREVEQPLGLTANFRSQAPVIGAVNQIGAALDGQVSKRRQDEDAVLVDRQEFTPLTVGRSEDGLATRVEALLLQDKDWRPLDLGPLSGIDAPDQGPKPAAVCAEALAVARRIRRSVDAGEVDPGEVAVLFRTRSNMGVYVQALAQYGLDSFVVGRRDFWESREAVDIRALLAVIANPLDDESLLNPLFGPACGLSSDAVLLLRAASGYEPLWPALESAASGEGPDGFPAADREAALKFVEAVEGVRAGLATTPLAEVLDAAITGTGYDLAAVIRGGPESLANLRRLVSLAAEYEAGDDTADLRGFLHWAEQSADSRSDDGVATQEESADVVRLMTIHNAKGLEFEMVCLPDLGKQSPFQVEKVCWLGPEEAEDEGVPAFGLRIHDETGSLTGTWGWDELKALGEAEAEDEELRLLHVAMTRARRILVLSCADDMDGNQPRATDNSATRLVHWLVEQSDDDGVPGQVLIPAPAPGVQLDADPEESVIEVEALPAVEASASVLGERVEAMATVEEAPAGRPPLRRPERSRRPDVPLSFSTLTVLEDCPARFYATQVLKIDEPDEGSWHSEAEVVLDPEDQSPLTVKEATAFGLAVHEVLEATAGRRWVRPTEGEIASRLAARGLDAGDQTVLGRATGMIFGFLDSPLGLRVAGERCDVELPLLFDAGGITIRGFADLLVPASDPPLILDYKSNRLEGTTAEAKMEEQYTLQRDLYGLAVAYGLGKETVDTAFVFLEAVTEPVELRLGPEELDRAQARLEGLTGMLRSGSFFGEDGAAHRPCGSCWACEQLADRIAAVDQAAA